MGYQRADFQQAEVDFASMASADDKPRRTPSTAEKPRADIEATWAAMSYILVLADKTFQCRNVMPQRSAEKWMTLVKKVSDKTRQDIEIRYVSSLGFLPVPFKSRVRCLFPTRSNRP